MGRRYELNNRPFPEEKLRQLNQKQSPKKGTEEILLHYLGLKEGGFLSITLSFPCWNHVHMSGLNCILSKSLGFLFQFQSHPLIVFD